MKFEQYYSKLCKPAKFYFIVSVIVYLIVFIQNITTPGKFSLGLYSVDHEQTPMILIYNALYILFWTFVLNMICTGSEVISWIIVLFPFILSLFVLGYILYLGNATSCSTCSSCSSSHPKGHPNGPPQDHQKEVVVVDMYGMPNQYPY